VIPGSEAHVARHRRDLRKFFALQRSVVLPSGSSAIGEFSSERWNRELQILLVTLAVPTIQAFADEIARRYRVKVDAADLAPFLRPYTRITAEATNATTLEQLAKASLADDVMGAAAHVFDVAEGSRSAQMAESKVTTEANLGREFAAKAADIGEKRWMVTSGNPRPSHAAMNGETTPMFEAFSNGAQWPGDPSLPIGERAGCGCMVEFSE
jgi:hypothetical protein